jgi:hypothetical protein
MTSYALVLLVHVTAVLLLFAAMSIETLSLFHLRRAATLAEAQPWINPVRGISYVAVASLLVILGSGIHLVIAMSSSREAWPKVAVAALFLMAPLGALTGRRMRAIRRLYSTDTAKESVLFGLIRNPVLKVSLAIRMAVFFGIFLLVNAQPGLWASIGIVAGSAVLGLLAAFVFFGRASQGSILRARPEK